MSGHRRRVLSRSRTLTSCRFTFPRRGAAPPGQVGVLLRVAQGVEPVSFFLFYHYYYFYFFEPDRGGLERTADSTHVRSRGGAGLDAGGSARPRDAGECLLLLLFLSVVIVTIAHP